MTLSLCRTAAPGACPEIRAIRNVAPMTFTVPVVRPRVGQMVIPLIPKHVTPWEAAAKIERRRLCGTLPMFSIEEHRVSAQASTEREPMGSQIRACDEHMFRSDGHRGRNNRYKDLDRDTIRS